MTMQSNNSYAPVSPAWGLPRRCHYIKDVCLSRYAAGPPRTRPVAWTAQGGRGQHGNCSRRRGVLGSGGGVWWWLLFGVEVLWYVVMSKGR